MPFEDLSNDQEDQPDSDNKALDELAGTLSEESPSGDGSGSSSDTAETNNGSPEYDPQTEPAFPTAKAQTQHSVYCLPDTWDSIDGASSLLFEAEISLRRDGYEAVQKRELHNALLCAAAEMLTAEDVAEAFITTRNDRAGASLLKEE
ncbi:hypothetical protein [Saliphagus infecundisoli]|uniref:Uncharacterized protein n=1 Tax=Saliphagus infecundisoli TaxID=1849069 RepID=A0ABD5QHI2_9EURY|nr:hypothetical protein [Saliphagus infecundisoli]